MSNFYFVYSRPKERALLRYVWKDIESWYCLLIGGLTIALLQPVSFGFVSVDQSLPPPKLKNKDKIEMTNKEEKKYIKKSGGRLPLKTLNTLANTFIYRLPTNDHHN